MQRKTTTKVVTQAATLFKSIKALIEESRKHTVRNVNTIIVFTYFRIGNMIVKHEQQGKIRAMYAQETLKQLSSFLTAQYGKGFSLTNLEYIRKFYKIYAKRIPQSVIEEFSRKPLIKHKGKARSIPQSVIEESKSGVSVQTFASRFLLSWTHYTQLLKIEDTAARNFYEIEAAQNNWSVRELQRQYHSSLYERLALSRDKKGIAALSKKGQIIESPVDALKQSYVLEFLNLKEDNRYSETDLETAVINRLEHFMLELGKGFLYEGRQKRFTFEGDNFWVDLVFYNRLLRCYVLLDLKIGKLTHQDIGQMQMYVNYYDRMVKLPQEKATIGIILCKEENKTIVEFTLPPDNKQIYAKEYKLYLPSKEALKKQLK